VCGKSVNTCGRIVRVFGESIDTYGFMRAFIFAVYHHRRNRNNPVDRALIESLHRKLPFGLTPTTNCGKSKPPWMLDSSGGNEEERL